MGRVGKKAGLDGDFLRILVKAWKYRQLNRLEISFEDR